MHVVAEGVVDHFRLAADLAGHDEDGDLDCGVGEAFLGLALVGGVGGAVAGGAVLAACADAAGEVAVLVGPLPDL